MPSNNSNMYSVLQYSCDTIIQGGISMPVSICFCVILGMWQGALNIWPYDGALAPWSGHIEIKSKQLHKEHTYIKSKKLFGLKHFLKIVSFQHKGRNKSPHTHAYRWPLSRPRLNIKCISKDMHTTSFSKLSQLLPS